MTENVTITVRRTDVVAALSNASSNPYLFDDDDPSVTGWLERLQAAVDGAPAESP